MTITKQNFGFVDEREIFLFTLSNGSVTVGVINYGATIVSIFTPDKFNRSQNILAGFPTLQGYIGRHPYFGSIVGRFANRIAGGVFVLNGTRYQLTKNDGENHLHGGENGFDRKVWDVDHVTSTVDTCSVSFSYRSSDGEEGYPGTLDVQVTYTLNAAHELSIEYRAKTDKQTPLNLTSHGYFNLTGFESDTIYDHELQLFSDWHTETKSDSIPTGRLVSNDAEPFDFHSASSLGNKIVALGENGYNHNFIRKGSNDVIAPVARLYELTSGRLLSLFSDQPGVQVYTANEWDGVLQGSHKKPYGKHSAIALETQHYPDSPNHPGFPDSILVPGESFYSKTVYRFETV